MVHGKNYATPDEWRIHADIFAKNVVSIEEHNMNPANSYRKAINQVVPFI